MDISPLFIGSVGVAILLIGFILNLTGILSERSRPYLLMNLIGALMAGWYAWQDRIIPFVILEIVWSGFAMGQLIISYKKDDSTF